MLISKNYLKQIIKEEIQKINEEQLKEKIITITPEQFLDLTSNKEINKELEARLVKTPYDPFEKAGEEMPSLQLDINGKVTNHEGRLRAFILNKNKINTYKVKIFYPNNFNIDKPNLMLFNQFDDEKFITINKDEKDKPIDILELGSINDVQQSRLSGIFRDIISNLMKNNNMSKEEAAEFLNKELQKYDVILNPPREEMFSIFCSIKPMTSAIIFKTNFKSQLDNPNSNIFQNPISWKDKITLRKK